MKTLLKRLFCKHEEKFCVTNIYGDMINHLNCRSIWECKNCGKRFRSDKLCEDCGYVNFRKKETNEND